MNPPRPIWWLAAGMLLLAVALRLAWLGDDAYITLRSVENWVGGNGLRWNAADRVQTYTHPAWMLLLAAGRWLTGEVYFATLAISLLLSGGAILMLLRRATSGPALLAATALLLGTRAFLDYTTSGLETPLSYALLVAFAAVIMRRETAPVARYTRAVLLTALLCTNRMDLGLLCAPAVLSTLRAVPFGPLLWRGALASMPFVAWLAFAALYYGSPFPVTAHAKAFGVGIPAADLATQGLHYARFALVDDPVLLPAIALGVVVGLARTATLWLALGALLYCGYVIKVGGDFMAGRFFLPPFVVAMTVLVPWLSARSRGWCFLVVALVAGAVGWRGVPAWLRGPASDTPALQAEIEAQHGIVDERRVHYQGLGLFAAARTLPQPGAMEALAWPEGRTAPWFLLNGSVGTAGFQMGVRGHLVDALLCDPLLTRLPARDPKRWRIGHVLRRIPEGYYESLATGENRLLHPGLREFWGALRSLTPRSGVRSGTVALLVADGVRRVRRRLPRFRRRTLLPAAACAAGAGGPAGAADTGLLLVRRAAHPASSTTAGCRSVSTEPRTRARELRLQALGAGVLRLSRPLPARRAGGRRGDGGATAAAAGGCRRCRWWPGSATSWCRCRPTSSSTRCGSTSKRRRNRTRRPGRRASARCRSSSSAGAARARSCAAQRYQPDQRGHTASMRRSCRTT